MPALSPQRYEGGNPVKLLSKNRASVFAIAGATALSTVAAVGALSPAGAANTTYSCTLPSAGATDFPVTATNPLPKEMLPGAVAPAHAVTVGVTLPEATVGLLKFLGYTAVSGSVQDTAYSVGSGDTPTALPLTGLAVPSTPLPATGPLNLPLSGQAGEFTAPDTVGTSLPVSLPTTFTFVPATVDGPIGLLPCTLGAGASPLLGTTTVVEKYSSKTAAKLKNAPITTSKRAKVAVKVVNGNGDPAAGKVVARKGDQVLAKGTLSDAGTRTLLLPELKRGDQKIVVKYVGDSTTEASKKVLRFTVRRG